MNFRVIVGEKVFILEAKKPLKVKDEFMIPGVDHKKFTVISIEFSPEESEYPMIIRADVN